MKNLKKSFYNTFGALAKVILFIVRTVFAIIPMIMIGPNFWLAFVIILIESLFWPATYVVWIVGFVYAIKGPQDI